MILRLLMLLTLLFFANALQANDRTAQRGALCANQAYTAKRSNSVTHDVDFSVVVTPPYHCKVLRVWLPIPPSDLAQQVSQSRFTTFPEKIEPRIASEPLYGNRFAYFEFHEPLGAQVIRHQFRATVWDLHWDVDPQRVDDIQRWPDSFEPYLQSQGLPDETRLEDLLQAIVPQRSNAANDLLSVMSWIDDNFTYDHAAASLTADANQALTTWRGHCSDYHGLCATMSRALGYPARVTYGLSLFPKNSPSHCKLEAFLPPYGWVSFDLSETQKLLDLIEQKTELPESERQRLLTAARRRLHRGFRENSWLLMTKGTDYELAPKAAAPVRVVRTAYVEADGEALPDPDPANPDKREFAWMTVHRYEADKQFQLPFRDLSILQDAAKH